MIQQTIEQLHALRLAGCVQALKEQLEDVKYHDLPFEQRLALIVDREQMRRQNLQLARRLKEAQLKQSAAIENVDFHTQRQLNKATLLELAACSWINTHQNLFIVGATGLGKTFIACALANKACRLGRRALYIKAADLVTNLLLARADGSFASYARKLSKFDLLIIDEWLRSPLSEQQAREVLDLVDNRYGNQSIIFVSQLPVADWHANISAPTIADAILDRIVHNAARIELKACESMRKLKVTSPERSSQKSP
jgi:DNA replication protein DnaC